MVTVVVDPNSNSSPPDGRLDAYATSGTVGDAVECTYEIPLDSPDGDRKDYLTTVELEFQIFVYPLIVS